MPQHCTGTPAGFAGWRHFFKIFGQSAALFGRENSCLWLGWSYLPNCASRVARHDRGRNSCDADCISLCCGHAKRRDRRLDTRLLSGSRSRGDGSPWSRGRPVQRLRHDRPARGSGLHHLRTYGCRAGRRAGMELRSVRPAPRGRQALRPRHHRHEGLSRLRIGRAPRTCSDEPAAANSSRILLRRRGGVPWRAASLSCVAEPYARGRLARSSASRAGCSPCARTRGRRPRGSR